MYSNRSKSEITYLAKLVDESSDAIFSRGIDQKLISWNKGAEQLFGYLKNEVIGKTAKELGIYKLTEAELNTNIQKITVSGYLQTEIEFIKKNGYSFTGSVTGNLIKGDDDEIVSYYFIVKDISQQKNLEYELKEANEKLEANIYIKNIELKQSADSYRNIFQNSPLPMWIYDISTFKFLNVNDIAIKEYGYSKEEFLAMTLMDIRPESELERFRNLDRSSQYRFDENYYAGIWKHKRKDGSLLDVEITTHLIYYKGVDAKLVLANNVTKRLEAENELIASEKRFRALIENSNDVISLMDDSFNVIYRSPSAAKITGWSNAEMMNLNGAKNIHPDDLEYVRNVIKDLMQNPTKIINTTFRNLHKNGHYIWLEGTAVNLLNDEDIKAIVFNYRDITERKEAEQKQQQSEQHLRYTLDNMMEGVQIHDFDWKYTYVNDALVKYSKFTKEELLGYSIMEKYPGIEESDLYKTLQICMNERVHKFMETEFRFPDNSIEYFELSIQPVPQGLFILSLNITERKRAAEILAKSELRYRTLLENCEDIVTLFDTNFKVIYRSPSSVRITGWTDEDMMGESGIKNIHPDDREYAIKCIGNIMENPGLHVAVTFRLMNKNGHYIWVEGLIINLLKEESVNAIVFNYRDITERKESEHKLAASELKFRSLLEYGNDVVAMLDSNFKIIYRSPNATKLLGWTDQDMIGIKGIDNIHIDDRETFKKLSAKSIANSELPINVSFRMQHKDGHYLWIEGIITNFLQNKNINAFVFNFRDITEKKESIEQLAASELRFRTLIENGNDIVSMFDEDFNVIYRSPSAARVTGWEDEDIVGEKGTRNIHPVDMEYCMNSIRKIKNNPGIPDNVSFRMKHFKGHYIWVEGVITNLLHDKNINAIVFNFRDITEAKKSADELKASENKYRSLIEDITDGFIALDNELKITYLNKVTETLFNKKQEYLVGKQLYEEFKAGIGGEIHNTLLKAIETRKPLSIETYSVALDIWMSCIVYPSEAGLTCFIKDLTEKKKLEKELEQQQQQEQLKLISATIDAQEKERNAIGIELHDNVNQILVGTTLFLSMLKKKSDKDEEIITECIDNIKQAINENRKIAHLLVSPDLEHKNLTVQIESLCENMLKTNSIATTTQFNNYNYSLLQKDHKVAIYRIVQEQITNIVKYAEATKVHICLSTVGNQYIRLKIEDNGKGMEKDKTIKGIGLRNINSRLSVFNGKMNINTSPGKGFALEIEIPLI